MAIPQHSLNVHTTRIRVDMLRMNVEAYHVICMRSWRDCFACSLSPPIDPQTLQSQSIISKSPPPSAAPSSRQHPRQFVFVTSIHTETTRLG